MTKVYNFKQRCAAWYAVRSKKLTASNGQAIANNGRGLETYIHNMLDIYYGLKESNRYTNKDMEDGIENEKTIKLV